ncbi:MAG: lanthionine synthetase LanC family protein [Candidatus Kariarchaeaceae archaeon]|jgi:rhamnogalacturonyl hydrolase YesR
MAQLPVFSGKIMILLVLVTIPAFITAQAPILPEEDDRQYYGLHWGAAGIAHVLFKIAENGLVDDQTKQNAMSSAIKAVDAIWDNRYVENNFRYATWAKFETASVYPGQKYGAAGIIKVFIDAYQATGDSIYLKYAEDSLEELFLGAANASTYPHWPYSYYEIRNPLGIAITDIKYGSLGMIDAALDLFEVNQKQRYLEMAERAAGWAHHVSGEFEVNGERGRILPWYDSEGGTGQYHTSYGQGNAGAIPVLLRLALHTSNIFWKDWATFIAKWIVSVQQDEGQWAYNIAYPDNNINNAWDLGIAGIVEGLLVGRSQGISFPELTDSITLALNRLKEQVVSNSTLFLIPTTTENVHGKHDLFNGLTGFLRVFRISELSEFNELLSDGYTWLLNNASFSYELDEHTLLGLMPTTYRADYTDLSYSDGLAGVTLEILDAIESGILPQSMNQKLEEMTSTFVYHQLENGLWPRQIPIVEKFRPTLPQTMVSQTTGSQTSETKETHLSSIFTMITLVSWYTIRKRKRN